MAHKIASFVRNELIPESPPPVSETGAIKWMRENLFSSPLNIIMTIASLWAVYTLFNSVAPWFLNGVWSGNSVRDCYEILDGATGHAHLAKSENQAYMYSSTKSRFTAKQHTTY